MIVSISFDTEAMPRLNPQQPVLTRGGNLWSTTAWSVIRAVCGVVAYPQTFNCPDITVEVIGNHSNNFEWLNAHDFRASVWV
jgi:hypothetical protein